MTVKRLQRARAAAWTPYSIPLSLRPLYVSAADHDTSLMTDDGGGLISAWTGRQGGLAFTAATTARPTWTESGFAGVYPAVGGDGSSDVLTASGTGALPIGTASCVVAALVADFTAGRVITWGGTATTDSRRLEIGNVITLTGSSSLTLPSTVNGVGPRLIVGTITSTQIVLRIGGVEVGRVTGTLSSTGSTRTRLFANNAGTAASFGNGEIAELLIGTTWTERQILQFEGYCAHAYPLAGINLPDSHPYKYSAP